MTALAILIGSGHNSLILHTLWTMTRNVIELRPLPLDRLREMIEMLYWTVRYDDDDEGRLWQIVEDREGNRYRILIRDTTGEMKW
jgi:hypothetical protein